LSIRQSIIFDFFLLTVLWLVAIVMVNPFGDFPLNDDWSYAIAVQRMLESGDFRPLGWTSSALITQTLWGTAFCSIFSYSFEVLRGATLVVSLLGIFTIYLLTLQLKLNRKIALLLAICTAFNPLWFALSFTFMTDVYFATFTAITLLFFVRFFQHRKWIDWSLGIAFSLLAILCRQFGLFVPMAFCVVFLFVNLKIFTHKKISLGIIFQAILPLIAGITILFLFQNWMENTGRTPFAYGAQTGRLWSLLQHPIELPFRFFKNTFIALIYLGWFLLPLYDIPLTVDKKRWILIVSTIVFFVLFYFNKPMPLGKNIIQNTGIGPLSLYDTMMLDLVGMESIGVWFWWFITGISVLGGVLVLYLIINALIQIFLQIKKQNLHEETATNLFFLSGAFIYFLPIALHGFFDRYLLPLLFVLPLAVFVFYDKNNTNKKNDNSNENNYFRICIIGILLIIQIGFSVIATHDYLSWNRTRWAAIHHLTEIENVPLENIDGGLEFNGLYFYDAQYQAQDTTGIWWWTGQRDYVLSFSKQTDYKVIKKCNYPKFINVHQGTIFILKRK